MSDLPPLLRDQHKVDADQLRLLAIFHYVFAALAVLGLAFLAIHYAFMRVVFNDPHAWKNSNGGPPPQEIFAMFKWFYVFFGVVFVAVGICNLLSGRFLQARQHRMFSLVIAGIDVLQFPFGTILGVFTFIVLLRDSVREAYRD